MNCHAARALAVFSLVTCSVAASSLVTRVAEAEPPTLTLLGEGSADVMLSETYRDRFDWGGRYALRAGLEFLGPLAVQIGFTNAWFPVDGQDPGNLYALTAGARGFFIIEQGSALGGPWVDVNLGLGVTGDLPRFFFDVGVGWDFLVHEMLAVGPLVRYEQVVQPPGETVAADAYMLAFGVNVAVRIGLGPAPLPPVVEEEVAPALPPPDQDADGLDDAHDRCADTAEDVDGFSDDDGCPDPDNDGDGLDDGADTCPDAPEVRNGFEDEDGCPDETPTVVVRDRDRGELLPQQIHFRLGSDRVSQSFGEDIQALCTLLASRPEARLRVIGHADETGTAAGNHRLGAMRAGAVAEQLVLCGVNPDRIESRSYGDTRRECTDGESSECHAQNRRVELRLLPPQEAE